MISFLTQLRLDEVSSVGKAANPDARILLIKRAAVTPEDALRESVRSAFDDDDLVDKAGFIEAQLKDYRAHIAKGAVAIRKGATEMSVHDETIIAIAKNVVERGAPAVFDKSDYIAAIARRADEIRKSGESTHQAFARAITQDDVGKLLYRASKTAAGPEVEPDGQSDYPASTAKAPPWAGITDDFGPANKEMNIRASENARANPHKSPQQAYATVWNHPNNVSLRQACQAEERKYKIGKVA